jgi:vancomycin resistance protein YoaR
MIKGFKEKIQKIVTLRRVFLFFYILLFFGSAYHFVFARRVIPGVKIGNVYVGGRTYEEAKNLLEGYAKENVKDLNLKYKETSYTIRPADVQLLYNWDSSVTRAFEVGRTGNVFIDSKDKLAGLFKNLYIPAHYSFDETALSNKLSYIKAEIAVEAKDAFVALKDRDLEITPAVEGTKVIDEGIYKEAISSFDRVDFSTKNIPTKTVKPRIFEKDVEVFLPVVKTAILNGFTITYQQKSWKLTSQQLIDLSSFQKVEGNIEVRVNKARFEALAESVSLQVNSLPRGKVVTDSIGNVTSFEIAKEGVELDKKAFSSAFKEALFGNKGSVEVPTKLISGPDGRERYGIYALLGEGNSKYTGSAPTRVHNILLASGRTDGVLVAPGGTYSMNNSIGEVSAKTGYDTAYIISQGRTVLGEGGGVCQVSTTLFRAVLNSGLPVTMRYPHAYRVRYYELDSKVGFDAAVFQPSLDLQFKNDTQAYVLVESSWNVSENSLTFKIYGTPDGRKVEISEPVITSQTPPPAPLYQDDPTLQKGVVRQVDFSAWGASVYFTRTVSRNGQVLFEDLFKSNYQPWREIYLVGTKEDKD